VPDEGPALLEVVVPARNEASRLGTGLSLLSEKLAGLPVPAAVLVVNNASTDATPEIVRGWAGPVPVNLVQCPTRGKGAAVRAGLLATSAPYVGFCDADMATDLDALDTVLRMLMGDGAAVVVGSRRHHASAVETRHRPLRRLGALAFNGLCRGLAEGIPDTQCGFKFFSGRLARSVAAELGTAGFAFDVELLMRCANHGARIVDIPVRWRDVPGSTFALRRHALECVWDVLRLRVLARRLTGLGAVPAGSARAEPAIIDTADVADDLRAG
jgi:dolichyl-phosphate beta-glucosyltransferase